MAAKASFRYRELVKRSCPWKYLTDNVREIVQSLKQVFMNLLESLGRTDFHGVENTGIKQPVGIIQTYFIAPPEDYFRGICWYSRSLSRYHLSIVCLPSLA